MKLDKIKYYLLFLVIISALIVILSNNKRVTIEGKVIDMYSYEDNYKRPTILILKDNSPYSVTFDNDVFIDNIELNDTVSILTDGMVRESYPMQITGFSIKLLNKENKNVIENVEHYIFNGAGSYENDLLEIDYHRFKTKIFYSMEEYLVYAQTRGLNIDITNENLENKVIIVSYSYMSSTPTIEYSKTYNILENTYVELNIKSLKNETDDIVLRGVLLVIDKEDVKNNIITLSKVIVSK